MQFLQTMHTKQLLLILGLMGILSSTTLHAQQQLDPLEYGVRVGLNFSSLYNIDEEEIYDLKAGVVIGGLVKFRLSRWLAVQPEVLFSQQGAIDNGLVSTSSTSSNDVKMNYLAIPVMLKIYPSRRFNLQLGPQMGFLLSSSINDIDTKEYFTSAELSLRFGLGYEFNKGLLLALHLNTGLTNINDVTNLSPLTGNPEQVSNALYSMSVGWRF